LQPLSVAGATVLAAVTAREVLGFLIAASDLALALIVFRYLAAHGRAVSWPSALIAFFVLRAIDRVSVGFLGREPFLLGLLLDLLLLLLIAVLIVGFERMARALRVLLDQARHREAEYGRALSDYRALARHRLANPLTAILGSVQTLQELPSLDGQLQRELLANIREQAQVLAAVVLEPRAEHDEERDLKPVPQRVRL